MSNFFKKLFGALTDKPWEKEQMVSDNYALAPIIIFWKKIKSWATMPIKPN